MLRALIFLALLAASVLAAGPVPLPASAAAEAVAAPGLKELLTGEGPVVVAGRMLDRAVLFPLYENRDFAAIWATSPEREAALVAALKQAPAHGLDPAQFTVPAADTAERELLLTDAFLRYASTLARGQVDSAELEEDWALARPDFDAAAALERAANGDAGAVLASLAPAFPGYKALQGMLARYEALAAAGGWSPVPGTTKLKRHDKGPSVAALRARLEAEGYDTGRAATAAQRAYFSPELEAALKRYQARNGLAPDGTVGPGTYAALNISAAARVEQIRANLERWRELPRDWPALRIEVNVPGATMSVIENEAEVLTMKTIVGAEEHPTPVMRARMVSVLFNPPWNVPASIVKKEILPHVRKDPDYLDKNHYVYTETGGMQQLPGPSNALGRIKFELPNSFDVYLHDTPTHPLFSRAVRTLSHGCIRLEDPRRLALYVLNGQRGWTENADIDRAVDAGTTRRVMLHRTLPVYILYWTAFVNAEGEAEFRDDIYDRDKRLTAALTAKVATAEEPQGLAVASRAAANAAPAAPTATATAATATAAPAR